MINNSHTIYKTRHSQTKRKSNKTRYD